MTPQTVYLPCGHTATHDEILRLAGAICAGRRKTTVAGPGRPRTAPRCACGAMTLDRASKRKHVCS